MSKLFFVKILLIVACGISFSCSNENNLIDESRVEKPSVESKLSLTSEQNSLLQSRFKYSSYDIINIENQKNIISDILNSDIFVQENINIKNFDTQNVAKVEWGDYNKVAYILKRSVDNAYYSVVLDTNKAKNNSKEGSYSFKFLINSDAVGTGSLSFKSISEERVAYFENGKLVDQKSKILKKNEFRQCFDETYDTICDGFIGCLAWYTNPPVPLLAAVYCAVQ